LTDKDQGNPAKSAHGGSERGQLTGHFVLDLPQSDRDTNQRQKPEKRFFDQLKTDFRKPRFYLEIAALIGLFCYAHSASIQATANQTAATAAATQAAVADEAMRVSNRPYVEVSGGNIAQWIYDPKGAEIGLKISFENYGATPASQMLVNGCLMYDGASIDCLQKWVHIEPARTLARKSWQAAVAKFPQLVNAESGTTIPVVPVHEVREFQVFGVHAADIAASVKQAEAGNPVPLDGTFEYLNVFGEYCCKQFSLLINEHGNFVDHAGGIRLGIGVCPTGPEIHNVCADE
jgi:hypothetical protein